MSRTNYNLLKKNEKIYYHNCITPLYQVSPDPDETTQIIINEVGSADIDRSLIEEYEVFITDDNQLFVKMNCSNETEITILDSHYKSGYV